MNVGDRRMFRSEPCFVLGFYKGLMWSRNPEEGGWVLIERSDGSRRYVKAAELHPIEEKERSR